MKLWIWSVQYFLQQYQTQSINRLIEDAIVEADQKGCKVLTLGLLNQVIILLICLQ